MVNNTLYFSHGKWASGFLTQRSPTFFRGTLTTDLVHHIGNSDLIYVDFLEPEAPKFNIFGFILEFRKDFTDELLPEIPWAPDSCSPVQV